jgi:hypothetical protein
MLPIAPALVALSAAMRMSNTRLGSLDVIVLELLKHDCGSY